MTIDAARAAPGTILGDFEILGVLGRGGMGTVFEARQLSLERPVALKVLAAGADVDAVSRERFAREARVQAQLSHPHVLPLFEAGEAGGLPYLAMPIVRGATLAVLVRAGALDPGRAVRLLAGIADALDVAHERGIVHRDVKPQNVLVGPNDHAYLADFGVTRVLAASVAATRPGGLVGSLHYVAPEVIGGEHGEPAADRYAFAAMAHFALTGRPPFDATTEAALLDAHLRRDPPAAEGLPRSAQRALRAGLAKRPGDRPDTCRALVEALAGPLRITLPPPVREEPAGPEPRAAVAERTMLETRAPASAPEAPPSGTGRRRAAALAVLAVAGAGAGAALAPDGPGPSRAQRVGPVVLELPEGWRADGAAASGDGARLEVSLTKGGPRGTAEADRLRLPGGRTGLLLDDHVVAIPVRDGWVRLTCTGPARARCRAIAARATPVLPARLPDPDPAVASALREVLGDLWAAERRHRRALAVATSIEAQAAAARRLSSAYERAAAAISRAALPGSPAARATGPLASALSRSAAAARDLGSRRSFVRGRVAAGRAQRAIDAALRALARRGYRSG